MAFMDSELEIQIHCKYLYSLSAVEIEREFYKIGGSNFKREKIDAPFNI